MKDYVYDLETYPNVFTMYIGDVETRQCWGFEISFRKDQREALFNFLRGVVKEEGRLVGFNNLGFDEPVLQYILKNQDITPRQIYNYAKKVIESEDKFQFLIRPKDRLIPQMDLYKIHHFDNNARATSLKMLEFVMRSDNIEDLPYAPGSSLTTEQVDNLMSYNKHDMYQTYLFYKKSEDHIALRQHLTEKYSKDFTNHNATKIGKDYFIMRLEENSPGCCYKNGKVRQTKRNKIKLGDCILPYIQFNRPEFQAVKDWLSQQVISETKGVFNEIPEHELGDLAQYCDMRVKKKKLSNPTVKVMRELRERNPKCWFEETELKSGKFSTYVKWNVADNLNTIVDGFQYDFGTGGIHGSIESTIVDSDDEYVIVDKDVTSYYPMLAIVNRVYPEHLGEMFCDIYQDVFEQRKSYVKKTAENEMMKLALNGVYGDSNNKYSPFYDPKYTMTITVSGQLSLCMLAEKLLTVNSLSMVQVNTDGLTYRVHRDEKALADALCGEWMNETGLQLEEAIYQRMAIRDVNSYLALDTEGKVKEKGAYQYTDLEWHKNHSAMIIPFAATRALLYNENIEDVVMGHEDIYDFMYRTKVPRTSRLLGVDSEGEHVLQNITRYYISTEGMELVKVMPPLPDKEEERRIGINIGEKVRVCNDIKDFNGNINYEHYIKEAEKLVLPLKENRK